MRPVAGAVTLQVVVSGADQPGSYAVRLGLGMEYGGQLFALADQPVTLAGRTTSTDDTGTVTVSSGLDNGDLVVVGGIQKLRPDQKVTIKQGSGV